MKESSLISFRGKNHKDIFYRGKYHKAMYLGNKLVWEKLEEENENPVNGDNVIRFTAYSIDGYTGDDEYNYLGTISTFSMVWEGVIEVDWGDGYVTKLNAKDYQDYFNNGAVEFIHSYYYPTNNIEGFSIGGGLFSVESEYLMKYLGLTSYYDEDLDKQITYEVDKSEDAIEEYFFDDSHNIYLKKGYYDENYNFIELDRFVVEKNCTSDSFPKVITVKGCITTIVFPGSAADNTTEGGVYEVFDKLPETMKNITSWNGFYLCTGLYKIPNDFFDNLINLKDISYCFNCCYNLSEIPDDLFDKLTNLEDISYCFYNCYNLSYVPPLWEKYGDEVVHNGCFSGCTNASNYDYIPDDWK